MELVELALAVVLGLVAVFALVLVLAQVRAVRLVLALALALVVVALVLGLVQEVKESQVLQPVVTVAQELAAQEYWDSPKEQG